MTYTVINNLIKLVLKNCEWTKKELEFICSLNQLYSIKKSAFKK